MKMAIIKKNQIIILVVSLMLITAGYLNYMYSDGMILASKKEGENFGDATLVSSNNLIEEDIENLVNKEEKTVELQSSITSNENDYFVITKLERSKMYSSQLETYQKVVDSTNSSQEQKNEATRKNYIYK